MGKKVIRLTEADIENIVKTVIEEQRRRGGGELNPKKRKNKDKTDRNPSNWNGGDGGTLNFDVENEELTPLAYNVTEYDLDVRHSKHLARTGRALKSSETSPQQTPPEENVIIPTFSVEGNSLPYADNMVMPYFDKYEGSKEKFKSILDAFVKYIKAGGGDKLDNVTIKGSADSGTPTLKVPSGYSELDHPGGTPYGGKTDPKEMNQYLADMRAQQYANVLINEIKNETGFDLKITVLPGDNYYGQGDGKRGIEYRKIILTPNAPEHKPVSTTTTSGTKTDGSKTTTELVNKGGVIPFDVAVFKDGQGRYVEGYKVIDSKNKVRLCVTGKVSESMELPSIFIGKLNSYVRGQDFYVNGEKVGSIDMISGAPPVIFTTMNYNASDFKGERIGEPRYFAGPITVVESYRYHNVGDKKVEMAYLSEIYFTFY